MKLNKVWAPEAWEDYVPGKHRTRRRLSASMPLSRTLNETDVHKGPASQSSCVEISLDGGLAVLTARTGLHIESLA